LLDIQSCQLDIDGDGYEDLFYYEGYNLSINPTPNPPPSMFMNEGKKLNKSFYLGKDIDQPHGVKLLVGDYNNDTFPDIFALVAIIPQWERTYGLPKTIVTYCLTLLMVFHKSLNLLIRRDSGQMAAQVISIMMGI